MNYPGGFTLHMLHVLAREAHGTPDQKFKVSEGNWVNQMVAFLTGNNMLPSGHQFKASYPGYLEKCL